MKPFGTGELYGAHRSCPDGSRERHRFTCAFTSTPNTMPAEPKRILYIAPHAVALNFLRKRFPRAEIVTGFKRMKHSFAPHGSDHLDLDITNMHQLKDASFDFLICEHVLEHVPEDRKAMRELRRVLAPGGTALISAPVRNTPSTVENLPNANPERDYGQIDHVRYYGMDFYDRLRAAGFGKVRALRLGEWYAENHKDMQRFGNPEYNPTTSELFSICSTG